MCARGSFTEAIAACIHNCIPILGGFVLSSKARFTRIEPKS